MKSTISTLKKFVACAALALAPVTATLAVPTLSFTSPSGSLHPAGSHFLVDVVASGFADLFAYQFSINFNPAILRVLSVTEGSFLSSGGFTFFDGGSVDNATGLVSLTFDTLLSAVPGVSGGGVLAHIDLAAMTFGTSSLTFSDVLALDSSFGEIAVTARPIALAVPEPDTIALILIAACGLFGRRRLAARARGGSALVAA